MERFANKRPTIRWVAAITAVVVGAALIVVYLQEILGLLSTLLDAAKPLIIGAALVAISVVLTFISGLIPSSAASRKDPVEALRSE